MAAVTVTKTGEPDQPGGRKGCRETSSPMKCPSPELSARDSRSRGAVMMPKVKIYLNSPR